MSRLMKDAWKLAVGLNLIFFLVLLVYILNKDETKPPNTSMTALTATPTPTSTPTPSPSPSLSPIPPTPSPPSTPTRPPTRTVSPTATALPTQPPTRTPTAIPPAEIAGTALSETTLTLPTYPVWDYLVEKMDPIYNMPVFYFDRATFEAESPRPRPVDYTGLVLENRHLRLIFLPELGGRLYSAVIKETGQEIFYHNPVVKPSRYGVLQPYEANWWLATGGMEWAYPTQEHGYRWGIPWEYETGSDRLTMRDTAPHRVEAEVEVILPADSGLFTVRPRLTNNGPAAVPAQFWLNAALTLGSASISPDTRFIIPVDQAVVHSRGEEGWDLPGAHEEIGWPLVGETDLSRYSEWANYLGLFLPDMDAPFMAAYNPETDLALARLIEPGAVPGNKLFAFGLAFPDRSYTDDNSQYFEIWGGANRSFWPEDDITLEPGQSLAWQESWWPLPGLGGLTWANRQAAIYLSRTGEEANLSVLVPHPTTATLTIRAKDDILLTESFSATPNIPRHWQLPPPADPLCIRLAEGGTILLDYCEQ